MSEVLITAKAEKRGLSIDRNPGRELTERAGAIEEPRRGAFCKAHAGELGGTVDLSISDLAVKLQTGMREGIPFLELRW